MHACVCVCLIFQALRLNFLVSYLKFRSALQKLENDVKNETKKFKKSSKKFSLFPGPRPPLVLLQVKDVAVCGDDVRPVSVVWSDKDRERSVDGGGSTSFSSQTPCSAA